MKTREYAVDRPPGRVNLSMNAVRIVAALLVVVSHVRPLFFEDYSQVESAGIVTQALYAVTSVGHPAVIVFFVLSGFWVGGSVVGARSRNFSVRNYSLARLTRLWLVLLPAIALTQLIDRLGTSLWPASDVYRGSDAYHMPVSPGGPITELSFLDTVGNVFFLQRLYVPALGTNGPLWSLASEFWYYVLFPAVMIAIFARARRHRVGALGVTALVVALLTLAPQPDATPVLAQFPAWLAGAALAWQRDRLAAAVERLPTGVHTAARISAIVFVVAAMVFARDGALWREYVLAAAAALMLATFLVDVRSRAARAALRPLSWAAEWSYSLYAIHLPILAFMTAAIVPQAENRLPMTPTTFLLLLLITGVPVIIAVGFYSLTERHTNTVRGLADRALSRRARSRSLRMET